MKNVLVTGGCGFIGSELVKKLVLNGKKVKVLDNCSRGSAHRLKSVLNEIEFIEGDIRNFDVVNKACENVESVHHLAYINGTENFYTKPDLVLDIAVKGLTNIIDGCIKFKVKELYLASSSEVYQTPNKVPTDEKEMLKIPDIFNPRYSYGGGKILTELVGINYGKKFFKKLIIFRPHNVYGKNMGNEHVIPEFISRLSKFKSRKFKIQGNGLEIRSFIHIDDFISAFDLIIRKGKHLNIYNIGTQEKCKIRNLAHMIAEIFKKQIEIKKGLLKQGSTKIRIPDISKIKKLGFKQKIFLKEGLIKIIKD